MEAEDSKTMKYRSDKSKMDEIRNTLAELFGRDGGAERFEYLGNKIKHFLDNKTESQILHDRQFNKSLPYENLRGKIFVIAYPDNVCNDSEYPLKTLGDTLKTYFPFIRGIHILPERTMSHGDVWPQDFFSLCPFEICVRIVNAMRELNIIDDNRYLTDEYESQIGRFLDADLKRLAGRYYHPLKDKVQSVLKDAYNSHFNDGGFSQKTRETVDPRFGDNENLRELAGQFTIMLDYVVNHLDVDNEYLENYRKGNNGGDAFIIINRETYQQLIRAGTLSKTFRPRPFPLFTGMRKYPEVLPEDKASGIRAGAERLNRILMNEGLAPLDPRLIMFLSIFFKIENDQGLTFEDRRIFEGFLKYIHESGFDASQIWLESGIQENQKVFNPGTIDSPETLLRLLGFGEEYAALFLKNADTVFGEEFYIYTTFSESQADINPLSMEGFTMIFDDLLHLLSGGTPAMMRMDAIKYLWKEIGKKNFDMPEGNALIRVIRLVMEITSPSTLPLDEVNSPDPTVYSMGAEGGFFYLFGHVNSVPAAFNDGRLESLIHFQKIRQELCPEKLLPFVTLSTHDGRSVQGLGVQHTNGHVTIKQFYNLMETAESRGGRIKFRRRDAR